MTPENVTSESGDEHMPHVISRGWLGDLIYGFSLPAIALPGRPLYSVHLHGSGITLEVEGAPTPIIGFYVLCHVSARNVREAEGKAAAKLRDWWGTFHEETADALRLEVDETWPFEGWFTRRSRSGFAYYHAE